MALSHETEWPFLCFLPAFSAPSNGHAGQPKIGMPGVIAELSGQFAVGDAVRARGLGTAPLGRVLLVVGEVALVPEPGRTLFPRQDVPGEAVEEPPVVGGDHGAAGELEQGVLQ